VNDDTASGRHVETLASLLVLWLSGACLRFTILAVPPLVPQLHAQLHLTESDIGLLSSLPPLMFSLAAIPGALLIARFGIKATLLIGLALNACAAAARGAAPDALTLYLTTIVMAGGVSIMQPALPPLVRTWFPKRIGFATAVYTNGLLVGETLVTALTIPLVLPLIGNSWRWSFVIWALPVAATAILVLLYPRRMAQQSTAATATPISWWPDWRHPLIWRLGILLGSVNALYFVANAFLPDYLTAQAHAKLISPALGALNLCQLPASALMLIFAGRLATRPLAYVVTGSLSILSLIGIMTMKAYFVVIWSGVLGFANAVTLILALALPSILSAPDDVHRTSAGVFAISYSCAVALALVSGWLWQWTHWPVMGFAPIALCALLIPILAATVRHARAPTSGNLAEADALSSE
jgi:MFS transporter, CP family, cyanate transporter